jgi:hypothetical protein
LTTGLKYLGKTNNDDPHTYTGSGKYWVNHIKKHGYLVSTEILKECQTPEELKQWGLYYSQLWNIVESDEWANMRPECGDGGTTSQIQNRPERIEKNRNSGIESWKNSKIRQNRIDGLIKAFKNPNVLKSKSDSMKRIMNDKMKNKECLKQYQSLARHMRNSAPFDSTIYTFEHKTGIIEQCLRSDLIKKYSLHRGNISSLISGKVKMVSGWKLSITDKE